MVAHAAAFVGISLLVIVTPGQDTALTIRNTLLGGRPAGVATVLGSSCGQVVWTLATSAGLAVLLIEFHPAFDALRLAGCVYLLYLGAHALLDAVRNRIPPEQSTTAGRRMTPLRGFRQGLLSNLGNPKMLLFFSSLLPQFAGGHASFEKLLLFGLAFTAMSLSWLMIYTVAVAKARALLLRSSLRRLIDATTGIVLIALGLRLATERAH
jgi:threonine/homoserine/homoserine lactone efflux protein